MNTENFVPQMFAMCDMCNISCKENPFFFTHGGCGKHDKQ